ncbi:Acetyltransferase (GNAT) family protein [Spirosomataceae bacterium TFI 002]|nr:Acetyltransferase (GNAT) family protein [Spirosomataceae bacterium TFI 002]
MTIREATIQDVPDMMKLVHELAVYEKAGDQVINTVEQMEIDGFGQNPLFGAYVAIIDGETIGTAIYYYRYSTWKGKRLYLEDIVVTESKRGVGAGKQLFEAILAKAKESKCSGLMWQVLDWNESAIDFYKRYDADLDDSWVNCNIDF